MYAKIFFISMEQCLPLLLLCPICCGTDVLCRYVHIYIHIHRFLSADTMLNYSCYSGDDVSILVGNVVVMSPANIYLHTLSVLIWAIMDI